LHGCCINGQTCAKSHDLDIILDYEDKPVAPKKRKKNALSDKELNIKDIPETIKPLSELNARDLRLDAAIEYQTKGIFKQNHSAAYDAYMTGYVFAHYIFSVENVFEESKNRIYLIAKQMPLKIEKSKYSKQSQNFTNKNRFL
jgi:target of EGR1 protein 1